MVNVTFLFAYDNITAEHLLIVLMLLQNLGINNKTLLKKKGQVLDGIGGISVRELLTGNRGGNLSRPVHVSLIKTKKDKSLHTEDYDDIVYIVTKNVN